MYAVLILFFLLLFILFFQRFSQIFFTQIVTFLKFQVLREKTNITASFTEHSVYIAIPKCFGVLILGFLFWFAVTYPKSMCKSNSYFVISGAPRRKKRYCFFREHPAYSNLKMYNALILFLFFWFPTIHPKCFCKSHFFLKFQVLHERSSVIASFVEHPVCSNFKIYSVLILFFLFWFPTIHPKYFCKCHLFLKF